MQRNRVKRLVREAFALESPRLPAGTDVVVVARHEARVLAEREGLEGVRGVLAGLIERVAGASGAGDVPGGGASRQVAEAQAELDGEAA